MQVKLLHAAPLELLVSGIRTCYQSQDKSDSAYHEYGWNRKLKYDLGEKDRALIMRIIESGHESTLEHVQLTFDIEGFSRDVLQEFSRHRVGVSPSVKSTRYTMKELKDEKSFFMPYSEKLGILPDMWRAEKYIVLTGDIDIDTCNVFALENARKMIALGKPNDKAKYCLPGAYRTAGQYTFNVRSLRHLLQLRTSPRALWEFQELCKHILRAIPKDYLFLFEDVIHKEFIWEPTREDRLNSLYSMNMG